MMKIGIVASTILFTVPVLITESVAFETHAIHVKRFSNAHSSCIFSPLLRNAPFFKHAAMINHHMMLVNSDELLASIEGQTMLSVDQCLEIYKGISFENGPRIPGSKYFDIDDISAQGDMFPDLNPKNLPHMFPPKVFFVACMSSMISVATSLLTLIPSPSNNDYITSPKTLFSAIMDTYNIQNTDHIIIYARKGVIFTPRMWFLFKSMGHDPDRIHLLQGSLDDWIEAGGNVESEFTAIPNAKDLDLKKSFKYKARDAYNVCDIHEVLDTISSERGGLDKDALIIDSRGSSFAKGHIPGAIHIPYSSFVNPDNSLKFKGKMELLDVFQQAGVDIMDEREIICSCGSGVSACHVYLALEECGRTVNNRNTLIYDGSWAEWGSDVNTPKILE